VIKLTLEAAQAFTNLRGNRDFENVLQWLKEYETKEIETCVQTDGVMLHRAQGAASTLRRIATANNEAPGTLQKIVNRPNR
jgi:hypothetical protein